MSTTIRARKTKRPRRGVVLAPDGRELGVISARLPVNLATDIRVLAAERQRTVQDLVEEALRRFLDEEAPLETNAG